ncbi:MAG: hypothetical protein Harvfovirus30_10 [Harvfovirus sp.]|uniref:Uncharacterized protein n=1 Tax=Harvfovirus sp. TaxID=2487768 RepID=A0A3G5A2C7_9VIRU|nr:MAG: hypothetical protein Harvfovirus30_10 [Harvfovirus sp.]
MSGSESKNAPCFDFEKKTLLDVHGAVAAVKTNGQYFNQIHRGMRFVLLSTEDFGDDYALTTGLNIFDVSNLEQSKIRMYAFHGPDMFFGSKPIFYQVENIGTHVHNGPSDGEYNRTFTHYREVTIPPDANIYIWSDYWKTREEYRANKLILSEPKVIALDNDICTLILEKAPHYLRSVKNPTEDMCVNALKKQPFMLDSVVNQTEKICITALELHRDTFKYVRNKTLKLYYIFIKSYLKKTFLYYCLRRLFEWFCGR